MKTALLLAAFSAVCLATLSPNPSYAQATRTWVSGVGDDANPCSRTAPCKTFAGAISKTAVNGIIDCLDPGGFGAVTIIKSITIDCHPVPAGVLAAGTNGININGAGIVVTLRGLDIEGIGSGLIGVNFINGAQLNVEDCRIYGFQSGSAIGINFAPPTGVNAKLHVVDSVIANNGTNASNGGIFVQPTGTGIAHVSLTRVQLLSNTEGLRADGGGGSGQVRVTIINSVAAGNTSAGIHAASTSALTRIMLTNSTAASNSTGVLADGGQAVIVLTGNTISENDTGLNAINGGATFSYNINNFINANVIVDGVPTNPTFTPH